MKKLTLLISMPLILLLLAAIPAKKNVLIIGDSISIGYTPFVTEALSDVAIVSHHKGNAQMTTNGVEHLDEWLGDTKWDVIHFNFGLWDLCYRNPDSKTQGNRDKLNGTITNNPEEYAKNLEIIVSRLKKTGAKLIFATTTYVPEQEAGRFAEDVAIYNDVAIKIMKKHNIKINPLNKLSKKVHPIDGIGNDDVHYNKDGYKSLSIQVAKEIKKML